MSIRIAGVLLLLFSAWTVAAEENTAGQDSRPGEFLKGYRPNYFLFGPSGGEGDDCDVKFQFSLKQRLAREDDEDALLRNVYFGYTQQSWWDICEESAPFRESQFNPEFFWTRQLSQNAFARSLQVGLEHNSNGRDGDKSRSWNRLYGQLQMATKTIDADCEGCFKERHTVAARLKAWLIINSGDENSDIEDYMGYADATIQFTAKRKQLSITAWVGKEGKTSGEFDFVAKSPSIFEDIPVIGDILPSGKNTWYWHVQYFNGYGDEMIRYDDRDKVVRFGIMFNPQPLPN